MENFGFFLFELSLNWLYLEKVKNIKNIFKIKIMIRNS